MDVRRGECVHQLGVWRLANGRTVLVCGDCVGILREFPGQQARLIRWSTDPPVRMPEGSTLPRSEAA
jgi:hypothetical protein